MIVKPFVSTILFMVVACILSGCFKTIASAGYTFDDTAIQKIIPGESRQSVVEQFLGSPSTKSDFGTETWYYMARRYSYQAFFKPVLVEQRVVAIEFQNGVVSAIRKYATSDAKDITFVRKKTPAEGHDVGIAGQLLGNVGRFNSKGHKVPGQP